MMFAGEQVTRQEATPTEGHRWLYFIFMFLVS